jgi:dTDP-4-amino-4,6-dideoxygalactose transaminase
VNPFPPTGRTPGSGSILASTHVPFVDLAFQHAMVAAEIAQALLDAMAQGKDAEGQAVARFETALAGSFRRDHCVSVADSIDTLSLMLRAAEVGPGDEVIVPANGRLATVAAVLRAGAWPILADCDPVHHLLDPEEVGQRLTSRTKVVVVPHLFGQMAPIEELAAVVDEEQVLLFEDAAQSIGASRHGDPPGTTGIALAISFHRGMSLGAYGGGGAVLTDDHVLAARIRSLHERREGADADRLRAKRPARLDASEAVVLAAKLRHLRTFKELRRDAAMRYHDALGHHERIKLPGVLAGNEHVWHRYVIRVPGRDRVLAELLATGIEAAVHYAVPLHQLPGAEMLGYREGEFPRAEAAAHEMLSLPIFPGIRPDQIERVAAAVRRALRR